MPPIDLYMNSAINANKASSVTPQTTDSAQLATNDAPSPATNTYHGPSTSYPAAKPGVAIPLPTASAQRYAPPIMQPTPTTTTHDFPPAPQPGAVPVPPSSTLNRPKASMPPPPKAGETFVQRPEATTSRQYPSQMYMPAPTTAYAAQPPASSTSTTTVPSSAYPVSLPASQLENPIGYRQNPQDTNIPYSDHGRNESTDETSSLAMDAQNVWETAKSWAQKTGDRLIEAESEVWKRVNK